MSCLQLSSVGGSRDAVEEIQNEVKDKLLFALPTAGLATLVAWYLIYV